MTLTSSTDGLILSSRLEKAVYLSYVRSSKLRATDILGGSTTFLATTNGSHSIPILIPVALPPAASAPVRPRSRRRVPLQRGGFQPLDKYGWWER